MTLAEDAFEVAQSLTEISTLSRKLAGEALKKGKGSVRTEGDQERIFFLPASFY